MIEFYPQIKWVHIAAVLASGSLFLLRGLLLQAGKQGFAMAAPVRYLSYSIDTVLLTAAFMLLTILPDVRQLADGQGRAAGGLHQLGTLP
jgi:uncharacterized membrane protein SirB2